MMNNNPNAVPNTVPKYSVYFYRGAHLMSTQENLDHKDAYHAAVPYDSVKPSPKNSWHVLMRKAAFEKMENMVVGEPPFKVAYQEPVLSPESFDLIMIARIA